MFLSSLSQIYKMYLGYVLILCITENGWYGVKNSKGCFVFFFRKNISECQFCLRFESFEIVIKKKNHIFRAVF